MALGSERSEPRGGVDPDGFAGWAGRSQLEEWSHLDDLERVLVSHGAPIERPQSTLRELAGTLS